MCCPSCTSTILSFAGGDPTALPFSMPKVAGGGTWIGGSFKHGGAYHAQPSTSAPATLVRYDICCNTFVVSIKYTALYVCKGLEFPVEILDVCVLIT